MSAAVQLGAGAVVGGNFRVIAPLAEGAMGAVYVAEHVTTRKQRALKVMLPSLVGDPKLRARFAQEAQIGASIESEHIVEVIDAGIDAERGIPWLAMELLKGATLSERLQRQGPLPAHLVREIFAQLCHAIGAAHDRGIVHRDLKPDNIFLAEARRAEVAFTVKVLDFGIAKLLSEAQTGYTAPIGTPMYMAPEQMVPGRAVSPACDCWALGLIAYHVFTDSYYWQAASVEAPTAMMLVNEVLQLPMAPASVRAAEQGRAHLLPAGFDAWFARAVQRDPAARFQHARDLFAGFEALLARGAAAPSSLGVPHPRVAAPSAPAMEPVPQTVREPVIAPPPAYGTVPGAPLAIAPPPGSLVAPSSALAPATAVSAQASFGATRASAPMIMTSRGSAPAPEPYEAPQPPVALPAPPPAAEPAASPRRGLLWGAAAGLVTIALVVVAVVATSGGESETASETIPLTTPPATTPAPVEKQPVEPAPAPLGGRQAPGDPGRTPPPVETVPATTNHPPPPTTTNRTTQPTEPPPPPPPPEPPPPTSERQQLEARVASGHASCSEIRTLRAICLMDGDAACRNRATAALNAHGCP